MRGLVKLTTNTREAGGNFNKTKLQREKKYGEKINFSLADMACVA